MEKTRLQNISETILQRIEKKKRMQEEQAYVYFDGIVDTLCSDDRTVLSREENDLSNSLNEIWTYRNLDDYSKETVFLLGSVWGAMKVEERKRERRAEASDLEVLSKKYQNYVWLLQAMERSPGINHRDLAGQGKKSPSELSQLITRLEPDGLFAYNRIGREKYYYIQERGRKVCKAIAGENSEKKQKHRTLEELFKLIAENRTNVRSGNDFLLAGHLIENKAVDRKENTPVYAVQKEVNNLIMLPLLDENRRFRMRDLLNEAVIPCSWGGRLKDLAFSAVEINPNVNLRYRTGNFANCSISCEKECLSTK